MKYLLSVLLLVMILLCGVASAEETQVYSACRVEYDDDDIHYVTNCGGTLYAVFESGLYRLNTSGEKTLVTAAAELPAGITALLADDCSVYAIIREKEQTALVRIADGEGNSLNQTVLTLDEISAEETSRCVVRNGYLYYADEPKEKQDRSITRKSLADGSSCSVRVGNLECFDVMNDGTAIALTRESGWPDNTVRLQDVSFENRKTELRTEIKDNTYWFDLLYDEMTGTVCLIDQFMPYIVNEDGTVAPVGNYSTQEISDACVLRDSAAVARGRTLSICHLHGTPDERVSLRICGPYADDEWFGSFHKAFPEVEIFSMDLFLEDTEPPEDRFIRDMLTQNPDVDIYILHDLNLLSVIKEKGFYADLSVSETINEKISRMYEPFVRAFTDNGKTAAFPHPWHVFFSTISYNKGLFNELNLSVPTTWDEYFDFCIEWKTDYEDDYPDISMDPFEHELTLVSLLASYDDEMARAGIAADYSSPELLSVIRKYLQVRELYAHIQEGGTPLIYEYSLMTASNDEWGYRKLPLTFMKESAPVYTPMDEDIYYFVVNPFSTHIQYAVECVASAKDESRSNEPNIYSEIPDLPLESSYYKEQMQDYRDTLSMLKARKEKEEDPEKLAEINEQTDKVTKEMQDYEENGRWWLTEEKMQIFRELNRDVYFSDYNAIRDIYAEDPAFFDEVTEKTLPEFMAALDNKIRMIRLERGNR